jgi:hypothetical protein
MSRYSSIFLFILACSAQARADVFLWSGNPDDVTITGINVEIAAAGTFKLEALTEPGGNVLADIGNVAIANGVTGTVIVFIERSTDNNNPGAVNVDSINLTNTSGVTGNLRELRITGDLGTAAASTVRNITGAMVVPGEISNDLTVTRDLAGNVTATSVSADIAISRNLVLNRTLDVGDMEGNITVNSRTFGEILASSLTGDITLADEVTPNGSITINST